jgi:diguanylate cyclase (GGDEF)-like protein
MMRTKIVTTLVVLMGLFAIAAIVDLHLRDAAARDAQLQLSTLRSDLSRLQGAPLKSSASTGGSPEIARDLMKTGKRKVALTLAALRRESPVAALDGIAKPLRADYAALDGIYAVGASGASASVGAQKAAQLVGLAALEEGRVEAVLNVASRQYDHRASAADARVTAGSAVVILLLLLGFALFYRRSVNSRAVAEGLAAVAQRLAKENARLAAASADEARTDALTGLRNRRALADDLRAVIYRDDEAALSLGLFDLDGFKQYNDTFGHPAGDALLTRLGDRLMTALAGLGTAYRIGGDEFCVLVATNADSGAAVQLAADALTERGDAFKIGCSYGVVWVPTEAATAADALHLADQRMYEHKASGRSSASRQSSDVLLKVLSERNSELREHLGGVARLAERTAEGLGLSAHEVKRISLAAALHDVGKTAIPDEILNKPGPLDAHEWEFMHRHTIIGERILLAAPSLAPTADLVRSSHERYDGSGYPDSLSGDEIPLGASIIAVCDAYDAMLAQRPYRESMAPEEALAELERCSGTQFHPGVVATFCRAVAQREHASLTPAGVSGPPTLALIGATANHSERGTS